MIRTLICAAAAMTLAASALADDSPIKITQGDLSKQAAKLEKNGLVGKSSFTVPSDDPKGYAKEFLKNAESRGYVGDAGFYKDADKVNCYNAFFGVLGSEADIESDMLVWKKWHDVQVKKAQEKGQISNPLTEQHKQLLANVQARQKKLIASRFRRNSNRIKLCLDKKIENTRAFIQLTGKRIAGERASITQDKQNSLIHLKINGKMAIAPTPAELERGRWEQHKFFLVDSEIDLLAKFSEETRKIPDVDSKPAGGDSWGEWNRLDASAWDEAGNN